MILQQIVDLMEIGLDSAGITFTGIKVCELGDQRMKWNKFLTGKNWIIEQGAKEHISIDLNGKHGALKVDLSKPVDKWIGYFDMVTNYGTAEHVEDGIYECYANIHNFTKTKGIMVHAGPMAGGCPWHSPYHYEPDFFKKLAEANGYTVIYADNRIIPPRRRNMQPVDTTLVCAVLIKESDKPFMKKEEFVAMKAIEGLK